MINQQGKFIVIEGLEGAGKSSAIDVVKHTLANAGYEFVLTREPGGTPMAEAIRDCVKADWQEHVSDKTELLLMYAARVQLVESVIKPALESGKWVIGDRHDLSSQAYQGGGRQINTEFMAQIKQLTLGTFRPDFTIYLDIDPETGLDRARGRGKLDRIEKAEITFFVRTRKRYCEIVEQDISVVKIDAMQPMDDVHRQIKQATEEFIAL